MDDNDGMVCFCLSNVFNEEYRKVIEDEKETRGLVFFLFSIIEYRDGVV